MTKRVMLTGGAGFIGHHILEHMLLNTDWSLCAWIDLTLRGH